MQKLSINFNIDKKILFITLIIRGKKIFVLSLRLWKKKFPGIVIHSKENNSILNQICQILLGSTKGIFDKATVFMYVVFNLHTHRTLRVQIKITSIFFDQKEHSETVFPMLKKKIYETTFISENSGIVFAILEYFGVKYSRKKNSNLNFEMSWTNLNRFDEKWQKICWSFFLNSWQKFQLNFRDWSKVFQKTVEIIFWVKLE